jgi:hypothetical protein
MVRQLITHLLPSGHPSQEGKAVLLLKQTISCQKNQILLLFNDKHRLGFLNDLERETKNIRALISISGGQIAQ